MSIRTSVIELYDAFNVHDLDRIMLLFADDCVLEMPRGSHPFGTRFEGKRKVREGLVARFEGLPDVHHYGHAEHLSMKLPIPASPNGSMPDARNGDVDAMDHHQAPAHRLLGQRAALTLSKLMRLNKARAARRTITDGFPGHHHGGERIMSVVEPIAELRRTSGYVRNGPRPCENSKS